MFVSRPTLVPAKRLKILYMFRSPGGRGSYMFINRILPQPETIICSCCGRCCSEHRFFVLYHGRNANENFGGYIFLQNTDLNQNVSTKVQRKCSLSEYAISHVFFFSPSHELILAFYSVIMQYNKDFTIPRHDNVKTAKGLEDISFFGTFFCRFCTTTTSLPQRRF